MKGQTARRGQRAGHPAKAGSGQDDGLPPGAPAHWKRGTVSARIVEHLRGEILDGTLEVGALVPAETQLAQRFNTNRNTVREALRALEAQDLISVRQGTRAVVRDFRSDGELNLLPAFLRHARDPAVFVETVRELAALRAILLEEAAARAAERRTNQDGTELLRLARSQRDHADDTRATIRGDLEFYRALIRATHSVAITWSFNTLVKLFEQTLELLPSLWVLPTGYYDSLEKIAQAIADGKPARAKELVRKHLQDGDRKVLARIGMHK